MGTTPLGLDGGTLITVAVVLTVAIYGARFFFSYKKKKKQQQQVTKIREQMQLLLNQKEAIIARLQSENVEQKSTSSIRSNMLDTIGIPVWYRDEELVIRRCNAAYGEIIDNNPEAPSTQSDKQSEQGYPELHKHSLTLAQQAQNANYRKSERVHVIVDGKRRLFEITEEPIEGGMIGFGTDVTEMEEREQEMKRHLATQSNLLESSASAIAIFGGDKRIHFYNEAYIKLWKLDERWLNTKPTMAEILDVLREKRRLPEQADFQRFKQDQLDLFTNLLQKTEEFYYLPDGKTLRIIIIPHEDGGLLFSYEDITDQITLERNYQTLLTVRKSTLDNLYEGVAVFQQNGRLQFCNPAFINIWELDQSIIDSEPHISQIIEETRHFYKVEGEWEEQKEQLISKVTARQAGSEVIERSDGSFVQWARIPMPDGGMLVTYVDITDSTMLEQSLRAEREAYRQAEQMKNALLTNVSYEFRSPITSIRGFAEVLQQRYFGELNDKQDEYIQGIFDASMRLNRLIDNILDVATMEAGRMELHPEAFAIPDVVAEIAEEAQHELTQKNITINTNFAELDGKIEADRYRIRQIISKLVNNAVRFTEVDGHITISARDVDDVVEISVADDGRGIPEEEQAAVFDKFHKASTDTHTSSGLGLTIAKNLVELHGGSINLQSEVDKGTTISFLIPKKFSGKKYERKTAQSESNANTGV